MAMQAESLDVLEKANVPASQARAIVRAIEIEIAGAQDVLATKQDVFLTRAELLQEISKVRQEIAGMETRLTRHMHGAILAQLPVLLGVVYFFVNHFVGKSGGP